MKLSPTEQTAIDRKALLTVNVSPDTRPEVTRRELADFTKELQKILTIKRHLKHLRLVLVETEKQDGT